MTHRSQHFLSLRYPDCSACHWTILSSLSVKHFGMTSSRFVQSLAWFLSLSLWFSCLQCTFLASGITRKIYQCQKSIHMSPADPGDRITAPSITYRLWTSTPANDLRILLPSIIITATSNWPEKYRNRQRGSKSANHSARTWPIDPVEPNVLFSTRSAAMIDGSEKRNDWLHFELQSPHVIERRSNPRRNSLR